MRAQTRGVALVALFAIALQIFSTFGHVHLLDGSGSQVLAKSASSAISAPAQDVLAVVDATTTANTGTLPAGPDGDLLCQLCLVGHLVASAMAASAPAIAVPVAYVRLAPLPSVVSLDPASVLTSFWSRGPPTS